MKPEQKIINAIVAESRKLSYIEYQEFLKQLKKYINNLYENCEEEYEEEYYEGELE